MQQLGDAIGKLARAPAIVLELDVDASSRCERPLENGGKQRRRLSRADVHPSEIGRRQRFHASPIASAR